MEQIAVAGSSEEIATRRAKFAIVLTWPSLKNAEYEVAMRLSIAGVRIGCEVVFVDDSGNFIWSSVGKIPEVSGVSFIETCDFAISLHFHSGKKIDTFTYLTLWNPPEFYSAFGYENSVLNLASYDSFLSCGAEKADMMAYNISTAYEKGIELPFRQLFHSPAQPYLQPRISSEAKLFYVGINWEKISGDTGRHHELLKKLDAAGMIDIYGPEEFHGVKPWEGYVGFRGSLPFDGHSIIEKINQAGVCLAFSSAAHQRSGIMSNRLFEGLAAGAIIIANPHPIIERFFSDCVYVVDDERPEAEVCQEILSIMEQTRRDPEEARRRAALGQRRLLEGFSLEDSLDRLVRDQEIHKTNELCASVGSITVVVVYRGSDINELLALAGNVNNQRRVEIHLKFICEPELFFQNEAEIRGVTRNCANVSFVEAAERSALDCRGKPFKTRKARLVDAVSVVETPYFCVLQNHEMWFANHLYYLILALENNEWNYFAGAGKIREDVECGSGKLIREMDSLTATVDLDLLNCVEVKHGGRFVFKRDVLQKLPPKLLEGLDGLELRAITLWASLLSEPAQSSRATYICKRLRKAILPPFDEAEQVQYVADSLRGSQMWRERRTGPVELPVSPSGPAVQEIKYETRYSVGIGGNGNRFLHSGFYAEEPGFRWIDSGHAVIAFKLPTKVRPPELFLMIDASSRNSKDGAEQFCTVSINDTLCLEAPVRERGNILTVPFTKVPGLRSGDIVTVMLALKHAEQVEDQQGVVVDTRRLGMRVHALAIGESSACMSIETRRLTGGRAIFERLRQKLKLGR